MAKRSTKCGEHELMHVPDVALAPSAKRQRFSATTIPTDDIGGVGRSREQQAHLYRQQLQQIQQPPTRIPLPSIAPAPAKSSSANTLAINANSSTRGVGSINSVNTTSRSVSTGGRTSAHDRYPTISTQPIVIPNNCVTSCVNRGIFHDIQTNTQQTRSLSNVTWTTLPGIGNYNVNNINGIQPNIKDANFSVHDKNIPEIFGNINVESIQSIQSIPSIPRIVDTISDNSNGSSSSCGSGSGSSSNDANGNSNDNTSEKSDESGDRQIKSTYVRPRRIFKNNQLLIDASAHQKNGEAFADKVSDLAESIAQQTGNPNFLYANHQYGRRIAQPSDLKAGIKKFVENHAPYFNVKFPYNDDQFINQHLQEIEKYRNNINLNIKNIQFNNFQEMVKNGKARDLGTLDSYYVGDIDKLQDTDKLALVGTIKNAQTNSNKNTIKIEEKTTEIDLTFYQTASFARQSQPSNVKFNI